MGTSEPESLPGEQVTHSYFEVLGVLPALARTFARQEDVPDAPAITFTGASLDARASDAAGAGAPDWNSNVGIHVNSLHELFATLASLAPARRATPADPMTALRAE
jgi:hypothetical protein